MSSLTTLETSTPDAVPEAAGIWHVDNATASRQGVKASCSCRFKRASRSSRSLRSIEFAVPTSGYGTLEKKASTTDARIELGP